MTDLEALIAELEASQTDMCDPFVNAATFLPIARELLAARKVVEAARRVKVLNDVCQAHTDIGFNKEPGGPMVALDDALAAYDAATSRHNEGDGI